ncbi:putative TetR family transcriptional regulator [Gordonia araii NBRC 100433]|uniref:Putative TetR family transcriptional regulator n=1 Tax=Gordonia araii NBRC 100433 TaxID=1073574 RepID=G7H2J3_9ACTN|nr:TetR/AcrR family transcriptional regulator [Gordonia araii]NNG97724.1 TetR/AcrR family transcriptional regulator [Gordonia araii NBRC 100433]GAB10068.1 putative TetR family transcriptional regulator [Gordonia araii NBRC 100433]
MRTHGWGGHPPGDDEEAVARILAATREVIDEKGASTSLADVARQLGVTRQTVYRYFPSTGDLLAATAMGAVGGLLDRIAATLRGFTRPDEAVVAGLVAVMDGLAADDYVGLVLRGDQLSLPVVGDFTSEVGREFARSMMGRMAVDWPSWGLKEPQLADISEIILRTLQSLVLDDGERDPTALAEFLDRWVGAAIREMCEFRPS